MDTMLARWAKASKPAGWLAALLLFSAPAWSQTPAESFVQQGTAKAIAILADKTLSNAQRQEQIANLMTSLLDLKRMALFTLGPAVKSANPVDLDAFFAAYRTFALATYEAELGGYSGQTLNVTGSSERAPGDTIVNATVVDPNDKDDAPAQVSFRVLDDGQGHFALVDASVEGVWFTLAQRDDFTGFLGQNGGDVTKLAAHLKEMAAQVEAGVQAASGKAAGNRQ
jgi:phospholipid transport system substrate-binding protein